MPDMIDSFNGSAGSSLTVSSGNLGGSSTLAHSVENTLAG